MSSIKLDSNITNKFSGLLDAIGITAAILDNDLRLQGWSNNFAQLFEIPETLLKPGQPIADILETKESVNLSVGLYLNILKKHLSELEQYDDRSLKPAPDTFGISNGETVTVRHNKFPDGYIAIFEKKKKELDTEYPENLLINIIDDFCDTVAVFDDSEKVVYTNKRYHEVFSNLPSRKDIKGMPSSELLRLIIKSQPIDHPLAKDDVDSYIKMRIEERRNNKKLLWEHVHEYGQSFLCRFNKTEHGAISLVTDITVRKNINEMEVRRRVFEESERRFKDYAASATDGFWEMDSELRISDIDGGHLKDIGIDLDDIKGKTLWEFVGVDPGTNENWNSILENMVRRSPVRDFRYAIVSADGTKHYHRLSGVPLYSRMNEFLGYRGTISDETKVVEARERADTAQQNLIKVRGEMHHFARISDMGQFASAIAHEINQPLAAITNYLRTVNRTLDGSNENISILIDKTLEQSERASQIIKHLRQYLSRGDLELGEHEIGDLIEEAVDIAFVGNIADTVVTIDIPDSMPALLVDRIQMQQVIVNFVRNALESMSDVSNKRLTVTSAVQENGIVVSVSDTGKGVPPELMETIFDPFVTSKFNGMGFGLSICQTIIEAHGGKIAAMPNPQGGMTFSFNLPFMDTDDA